jgi:hypothetical protein
MNKVKSELLQDEQSSDKSFKCLFLGETEGNYIIEENDQVALTVENVKVGKSAIITKLIHKHYDENYNVSII